MNYFGNKYARRDFLKRLGLAAPLLFGNPAAIADGWSFQNRRGHFTSPNMSAGTYLIKPKRLQFGDTVGIVAPAGPPEDPDEIDQYSAAVEKLGFKPKLSANIRKRLGYLAGTDKERAADLMDMFADRDVKAIFCLRGGYGSARLLSLLDFHFIRRHPKIFLGFSDITSLHCAFLVRSKLITFHGPTLNTNLTSAKPSKFLVHSLLRTLMEPEPAGSICQGYSDKTISILHKGKAKGHLIGGNLSVFCTMMGTPYQPRFRNNIFFFEDIGEEPYRLDRMLTQLLNAGVLEQVSGVAIGLNRNCKNKTTNAKEYQQMMMDVFKNRLMRLGVPVVEGLPFGHVRQNATLPVGIRAELDGEKGDLIITEVAVI